MRPRSTSVSLGGEQKATKSCKGGLVDARSQSVHLGMKTDCRVLDVRRDRLVSDGVKAAAHEGRGFLVITLTPRLLVPKSNPSTRAHHGLTVGSSKPWLRAWRLS